MAYSELIKDFQRIRNYMRQFYIYGFKSREEYDRKSARSYDNERRRIESWLGEYMSFQRGAEGKNVFLSVDSRSIPRNPFYKAFKAKSFTDRDITLHFLVMDILADGDSRSLNEIMDTIQTDYLAQFDDPLPVDESTLRKKLKEYCELGLIAAERSGREVRYTRAPMDVDLPGWAEAVSFFTEASPLGVVGSTLLDKEPDETGHYCFKHHYLLHALDGEVFCALCAAIGEKRCAELTVHGVRSDRERTHTVYPMKLYISTQTGREYLLCYHYRFRKPMFFRLDTVEKAVPGVPEKRFAKYDGYCEKLTENLWGVSTGGGHCLDHVEMTLRVGRGEEFILQRLEREKRCGRVESAGEGLYKYVADVYDAGELLPWMRTFIGRVVTLTCSDRNVADTFWADLRTMARMYGGDTDAV